MVTQRCILAAVMTVALSVPAWADFEEAAEAFKRGDYDSAYCELRLLAKKGHPVAQFHLGFLYDTGQGVRQDYDEAIKWYGRSARQGYFEAVRWGRAAQQGPWRPMPAGFVTVSRQSLGTEQAGVRAFENAKGLPADGEASEFLAEQLLFEEQLRLFSRKAD
jgi:TPR repeat protein